MNDFFNNFEGSLYDYRGDLRDWWEKSDRQTFLDKSQCFVEQYNNISFPQFKIGKDVMHVRQVQLTKCIAFLNTNTLLT